jgi:FAD synthase
MSWEKKVHVTSSLQPKEGQYAMFVGRWQPLHIGHQQMFQQAMDEGKNVLVISYLMFIIIIINHYFSKDLRKRCCTR